MPADDREQIGVLVLSIRITPATDDLIADLTTIDGLDADGRSTTVHGDRADVLRAVEAWLAGLSPVRN